MKRLLYFGWIKNHGHGLCDEHENHLVSRREHLLKIDGNVEILKYIDGVFTPQEYKKGYKESIVPPFRIIGWWDQTGDKRPGSNSNIIGIGYDSAEEMIDDACKKYPSVMNRQPRPVKAEQV